MTFANQAADDFRGLLPKFGTEHKSDLNFFKKKVSSTSTTVWRKKFTLARPVLLSRLCKCVSIIQLQEKIV